MPSDNYTVDKSTKKWYNLKENNQSIGVSFIKVLITTDLFTTKTNGVVTSTHNLIYELERRGHEVRVITFAKGKKSYKEGNTYYIKSISLEWVYPDIRMPSSMAGKFVKEIVEWKPDVIHSQCEYFSYGFARRIAKKTGAPIVHTYHTLYEDYVGYAIPFKRIGRWAVRNYISRTRIRQAGAVIAPTEKVKDYLLDICKIKNEIAVIPSGICLKKHRIDFTDEDRRSGRAKYGFTDEHFVFINLGRLGTEKNLEEVISYFAKISAKHENARLLIVGGGPALEGLEALARELEITDKVVFAGMVDPDEVARYYRLGDLFVCASTSETQGLTYIEATANGLPLLCHNDSCIDGVVVDGENAFRYETFEEYEKHAEFIMSDAEWLKHAKETSFKISGKFDRTVFGDSVERLYNELI